MPYPQPKYKEHVDVGSLVATENGTSYEGKHKQMFADSVKALYEYMRSNTFHFHGSSEGQNGTYRKSSALTPDGIVIHFCGNYTAGFQPVPIDFHFELLSFTAPVDKLKAQLTEIVQKECKKYRR
jgi:hypothetical protein